MSETSIELADMIMSVRDLRKSHLRKNAELSRSLKDTRKQLNWQIDKFDNATLRAKLRERITRMSDAELEDLVNA
jgi:hypothetical protein